MTYDTGSDINSSIERMHDKLAKTGDDIWLAPVEVDGETKVAVVRGGNIGKHVFDHGGKIEVVDPDEFGGEQ